MVSQTNAIIRELESIASTLKDAETGQRGFLLTNDIRFLEPYNGAADKLEQSISQVEGFTKMNPLQQENCRELRQVVLKRMMLLQKLIEDQKAGNKVLPEDLSTGRRLMDDVRRQIEKMQTDEENLLIGRTAKMQNFASVTPFLILLTSLIAIIITLLFYRIVYKGIDEKELLQKNLESNERETTERLKMIGEVADKVSAGNYEHRVSEQQNDKLSSLAFSLNKMAESLQYSFNLLSDNEWLQTGLAKLNEKMVGENDMQILTHQVLEFVARYTHSEVGAFYLLENESQLSLKSGYALIPDNTRTLITLGEGLVGQSALSCEEILIKNMDEQNIRISYATGEALPNNVIAVPILYEGKIKAVIELASLIAYSALEIKFLKGVSESIGIAINSAQNNVLMQELLEETQTQAEELQAQQSELENLNNDLEVQTRNLQASEEELKAQQEELMQINQHLEDRNFLIEEANKELDKKARELELSSKYKSDFLANMSHELRTPLNSILLLSRLMSDNYENNLTKEQIDYARIIQSSGNGLLALIDEIMDLAKIESGKMTLEYGIVSIKEITAAMSELFMPLAKEKGLELRFDISENVPSVMQTDQFRLEQILKNLLSNAIKFTEKGQILFKVIKKTGTRINFIIEDTGIGIEEDKKELIFEAFQQEDGSTRRKYGGTGLGLSISQQLANLLGGNISLNSKRGKGSSFIVDLPFNQDNAETMEDKIEDENIDNGNAPETQGNYLTNYIPNDIPDDRDKITANDKVILIVEDDTIFAKSLLLFTQKRGYKGLVAVRGDDGIELARQYKPMAILLDIKLPVMDGWQVMEALKKDAKTKDIPVHIMSSFSFKEESISKGAVDFIDKPVSLKQMPEIFEKIGHVLNDQSKKVLIVEENPKHARALHYFLQTCHVNTEYFSELDKCVNALQQEEVNAGIIDLSITDPATIEMLGEIKKNPGLEHLPVIVFTSKSLSKTEVERIREHADSIVTKTEHSYQRILNEISIFLHIVEENHIPKRKNGTYKKLGAMNEVLKDKTVLIADDDARNIFALARALENHKMNVITAIDGKEALELIVQHKNIDIVLMDMMMPEMDGYDAITEIRKKPAFKQLPILAVTAKAMAGDREKCIKAGASDYISKPVDIDQLLSLLRVWLYDKTINHAKDI